MSVHGQKVLILRVERAATLFRWIGLAIIVGTYLTGGVARPWPDMVVAMAIILGHNAYAHLALARRRIDRLSSPVNFGLYLVGITGVIHFTGGDESVAFILYPLFLIILTAYGRGARFILLYTLLCLLFFGGALTVEYFQSSLSRPLGELAGKMLSIAAAGWAVGVLSDQLHRNTAAARRHAAALTTSEATLRTVLNTAADLILVVDQDDRITDANDHACAFLRLEREEIIGRRPRSFLFDDGTLGVKFASLRAHGEYRGEMIVIDADGQEHTVDMLIRSFLRDGARFHVVMAQDITERKELEEATRLANDNLEQLNRELRQVDQMKREFFNTVSVRMRSPVAAILGYADMFLANELGELTAEQRRAVQTCQRSAQRLLEMVDEAIDIGARRPTGMSARPESPAPETPPQDSA